jgi:hypothetical protein
MGLMADRGSVASRVRPCSWETPAPEPAAGALIGVEHEYQVFGADGRQLDFRALIHSIEWDGLRLDPGDANAYRLRSGLVVTADGMEAETASPPVATTAGFDDEAVAWAARGKQELERGLGPDYRLNGYSTHISVAFPAERAEDLARLYALTFGPILARLIEGPGSLGLYVRPRPGRLELCGEYVTGERLRLAALFAVGSIRACAAGEHPPRLAARLLPGQERFGYRLHRTEAFGFDSYAAAGNHAFPLVAGGSASLGDLARTAVGVACRQLIGTGPAESRAMLRAALEGPLHNPEAAEPQAARRSPGRSVFGEAVEGVQRPSFRVRPEFATWGHTVFRAERDGRSAAFCVEGASLGAFLAELRTGALDSTIERALESGSQAPALGLPGQPVRPGIYGSVADPLALVPEEIPTKAGRQGKGKPWRLGKVSAVPAGPEPAPPPPPGSVEVPPRTRMPWRAVAAAALAAVALLAGALVLLTGGGGDSGGAAGTPRPASPGPVTDTGGAGGSGASGTAGPSETPPVAATVPGSATEGTAAAGGAGASETPRPLAATATHTPTQPAEPTPAATPTATQTLSPAPTPTPTRMVEPTPTATATPTRIVEPSPTPSPTPDGGPTLVPTLPPPAETASPVSTPCPPGQVCS